MARMVKFNGVTHSFPDDATDDEVASALNASDLPPMMASHGSSFLETPRQRISRMESSGPTLDSPLSFLPFDVLNPSRILNSASDVGGLLGGIMGGVPGAGVGGQAGALYREGTRAAAGEPTPDVGLHVLTGGGKQLGLQKAGDVLGGIVRGAAPWLMREAVPLTRSIAKEFPGIEPALVALRERIPVTVSASAPGVERAGALREASDETMRQTAMREAEKAWYPGATPNEVALGPGTKKALRSLKEGTAPVTDPAQFRSLLRDEFLAAHPNETMVRGVPGSEGTGSVLMRPPYVENTVGPAPGLVPNGMQNIIPVDKMIRLRQAAGAAAFRGTAPEGQMAQAASSPNWKLYNKALWENLTGIFDKELPAVAPINARTQELIALEKALEHVEAPVGSGFTKSGVLERAKPYVASRLAIALNRKGASAVSRQFPRLVEMLAQHVLSPPEPQSNLLSTAPADQTAVPRLLNTGGTTR